MNAYVAEVVPQYLLDDFKRFFFRVSRTTFENVCEKNIPIFKQLLVVLFYVSSQKTLNRIADRFDIVEASVVC